MQRSIVGMTWGAEDLSAALGASTNRDEDGQLEFTYKMARSLCLMAAVAAGIEPIDTVYTNFKDSKGLFRESQAARRAGFTGKVAIHPDQVEPINRASLTPRGHCLRAPGGRGHFRQGSARWRWMARCSTCRILSRPAAFSRRRKRENSDGEEG